jgi:hypothetical protein
MASAIDGDTPPTQRKVAKYDTAGLYCAKRIMYPMQQVPIQATRMIPRFCILSEYQHAMRVVRNPRKYGGVESALA